MNFSENRCQHFRLAQRFKSSGGARRAAEELNVSSGESALTFDRSAQWASEDPRARSRDHQRGEAGPARDASAEKLEDEVLRYQALVFRVARRVMGDEDDARDVTQEVLIRWLKNRSSMTDDVRAWLYRVTVNLCRDEFRRRARAPQVVEHAPGDAAGPLEVADPAPRADRQSEQAQRKQLLEMCLMELTERERMAIVLRDIEELGTRETAQVMEIREVTVRTLAARGRLKLAKLIKKAMKAEGQR